MVMILLALDGATVDTGWAVMDDQGSLVAHGCIHAPSSWEIGRRMFHMRGCIANLLVAHKVDQVAIEDCFQGPSVNTLKSLAMFRGIAAEVSYEYHCPLTIVHPTTVKKVATGKGNASKALVQEAVNQRFGLDITNDNTSDAIAIALAGVAELTK